MKLYVFQEIEDFLDTYLNAWIRDDHGNFIRVEKKDFYKRKFCVMTEINAHDDTVGAKITLLDKSSPYGKAVDIRIVHPKTKVKKWQWLYRKNDGTLDVTSPYETEEEALVFIKELTYNSIYTFEVLRKLEESEIEVEE